MTQDSPLAEANPLSLEELFRLDPLKLTEPDIDQIIAELRRKRALWTASEAAPKAQRKSVAKDELSPDDFA
jgi:hypothetical protein